MHEFLPQAAGTLFRAGVNFIKLQEDLLHDGL